MKTIGERAKESLSKWDDNIYFHYSELTEDSYKDGYIEGATEQKQIDIDKACEWLKENGYLATNGWYTIKGTLEDFRKSMEE